MKNKYIKPIFSNSFFLIVFFFALVNCTTPDRDNTQRIIIPLSKGWKFNKQDIDKDTLLPKTDTAWKTVTVPHDWAISGQFDPENDVIVHVSEENGEKKVTKWPGITGALPHVGKAWYLKNIEVPDSLKEKNIYVEFDGVMSRAQIYLNEEFVGEWPYGYASFHFNLTDFVKFGEENTLAVYVNNMPNSSRWYPGAGIYRNVRLVVTNKVYIPAWGTYVTTPDIQNGNGMVKINTRIVNSLDREINASLISNVVDEDGKVVAESIIDQKLSPGENQVTQKIKVLSPELWSPDQPVIYNMFTQVEMDGKLVDEYQTPFGFRYFKFDADHGFSLNGNLTKLKGVCLHHDLGPLGAAVNISAMRRQLDMLKEMGCNAIRTSHNPPSPELLYLADTLGFIVIDEVFDEWREGKIKNGYSTLFDQWAEKDLKALIHRDRNHPSIIMWSIGNEVIEQESAEGAEICRFLTEICHREDPTRPVTAGFNQLQAAIDNGLAEIVDVPGWNYKPQYYHEIHKEHPEWKMYGSETASTVSSRGEYFFPAQECNHCIRESLHCSSYDLDFPSWANTPDVEFAAQDDNPFMGGEFVWTGFDYLGEPTPYLEKWPARSSYFGIIDLAGIPKDRYYLYQSKWSNKDVLHILPHWNWEGKEGEIIPVHCYTSFDSAELFLNGKSKGIRRKDPEKLYERYRLIWENITYEPGELKVVSYGANGEVKMEDKVITAGSPAKIALKPDHDYVNFEENELAFVTVQILDNNEVLCPKADKKIDFSVEGAGKLKAIANGDPTSLDPFVDSSHTTFNGKCVVVLQPTSSPGKMILKANAEGLEKAAIEILVN